MSIVRGEAVLLSFWDGEAFVPFACTRSITINLSSELIGKSTVGSGDWKEKEVTALDWNFNFEGITYLALDGYYDLSSIIDLWITKTLIQVRFFISDGTYTVWMQGNALITSVTPTGSVNNVASVNVNGEGTGALLSSTNFKIIQVQPNVPGAGQTTLTFTYDSVEGATAYTIKVIDNTAGTEVENTQGEAPVTIVVNSTHSYTFMLRVEPDGGEFFGYINWP